MNVYRVHVKSRNKAENAANLEVFVRAIDESAAVARVLKECPGLTEFAAIMIDSIPNGVIIND